MKAIKRLQKNFTKVQQLQFSIHSKAVRIIPAMKNDSSNGGINYPNVTFNLSPGTSFMNTLVTIPSQAVSEIARKSSSSVFYATVIGKSLSLNSNQNASQVNSSFCMCCFIIMRY